MASCVIVSSALQQLNSEHTIDLNNVLGVCGSPPNHPQEAYCDDAKLLDLVGPLSSNLQCTCCGAAGTADECVQLFFG